MQRLKKEIFVFGSNLAGRHGKGAALHARNYHGAVYGVGEGMTGSSYAIPTKDENLRTRSLKGIAESVETFLTFARANKDLQFMVTKVGCGLGGYREEDISPMFKDCPENCTLPEGWQT